MFISGCLIPHFPWHSHRFAETHSLHHYISSSVSHHSCTTKSVEKIVFFWSITIHCEHMKLKLIQAVCVDIMVYRWEQKQRYNGAEARIRHANVELSSGSSSIIFASFMANQGQAPHALDRWPILIFVSCAFERFRVEHQLIDNLNFDVYFIGFFISYFVLFLFYFCCFFIDIGLALMGFFLCFYGTRFQFLFGQEFTKCCSESFHCLLLQSIVEFLGEQRKIKIEINLNVPINFVNSMKYTYAVE